MNPSKISITKINLTNTAIKKLTDHYIALDIETTGLNPQIDKIIEIAAILFENGKIIDKYSTLINPSRTIPFKVTQINNITNRMVQNAPTEKEAYEQFPHFLQEALNGKIIICAHNAPFDIAFLKEFLEKQDCTGSILYIDTLPLAKSKIKNLRNYKQNTVANHFKIHNKNPHRAFSDAETCGKILWKLLNIK